MIQNDVLSTAAMEGREEGRQEGRQEEKIENARTMKSLNISADIIHQVTGLPLEEIDRL